jgi:putative ABC transport system permease protein
MKLIKLIIKNAFRHPLRTVLTVLGLALTITAFGIVRNILVLFDLSRADLIEGHLITRHKTSLMQFLPESYKDRIAQLDGVKYVAYAHWVGTRYGDNAEEWFGRMAVDPEHYFDIRTDMKVPEETLQKFKTDKRAALVTPALALDKGWKEGDHVTVGADFFEGVSFEVNIVGNIEFVNDEENQAKFMMMRADYFAQRLGEAVSPELDHSAGWFEELAANPDEGPEVAKEIDSLFANSDHETLTETVGAFASMQLDRFRTIITALQVSSFLMIVVILLVLLNTMSMVARERIAENAVLKTLGFRTSHLTFLNFGESLFVALMGGALGAFLIWPGLKVFKVIIAAFQGMEYQFDVLFWVIPAVIIVGIVASIVPIYRAVKTTIVEGLRTLE